MADNGLLDNLFAAWTMDWAERHVGDVVGHRFPLIHEAGATISIAGFVNGLAKSFGSDTGNRLSAADPGALLCPGPSRSFSVAAWVKAVRTINNPYLAKWNINTSNFGWRLWTRAGSFNTHRFSISRTKTGGEDNLVEVNNPDTSGTQLQLVTAGWDHINQVIWIKRNIDARVQIAEVIGPNGDCDANLTVGWFRGSPGFTMGSQDQDESYMWIDRVLSDSDVALMWNSGIPLPLYQWDHSDAWPTPIQDETNVKKPLVSFFEMTGPAGTRPDAHGPNDLNIETNGPVPQGAGGVASGGVLANHLDLSANPGAARDLRRNNPTGMDLGAGSFTVCALVDVNVASADPHGIIGRWRPGDGNRQFLLWMENGTTRNFAFSVSSTGADTITVQSSIQYSGLSAGSHEVLVFGWYDGAADTLNIQVMGFEAPQTAAGPATVHQRSDIQLIAGFASISGVNSYLHTKLANVGYWSAVLTQEQRNYVFNFHRQRTYAEFPEPIPDTPTNFTAIAVGPDLIRLTWDDTLDEDTFEIQRSGDLSSGLFETRYLLPSDTTTLLDGDRLVHESEYCYRIRTLVAGVPSPWSPVVCATTLAIPNPTVPADPGEVTTDDQWGALFHMRPGPEGSALDRADIQARGFTILEESAFSGHIEVYGYGPTAAMVGVLDDVDFKLRVPSHFFKLPAGEELTLALIKQWTDVDNVVR